jgi:hypothetical protein
MSKASKPGKSRTRERSIKELIHAIRALPEDRPVVRPRVWYRSQKEHWLGWLSEYAGPGAYGRKVLGERRARVMYGRIVNYQMLTWLAAAAGVDPVLVARAREAAESAVTLQARSAAVRRIVPWDTVAAALWS